MLLFGLLVHWIGGSVLIGGLTASALGLSIFMAGSRCLYENLRRKNAGQATFLAVGKSGISVGKDYSWSLLFNGVTSILGFAILGVGTYFIFLAKAP